MRGEGNGGIKCLYTVKTQANRTIVYKVFE